MRKIIFLCLSLLVNLSGVMAQNDAMFVYRNDGAINAFLNADVDSMRSEEHTSELQSQR